MPLIHVLLILAVIGLIVWLIDKYIPMEPTIKRIIIAVAIIGTILWLLSVFGVIGNVMNIRIGK